MASGGRRLLQTFREKVLSSDINRRQSLLSGDAAELWRWMLNVGTLEPQGSFGVGSATDESDLPGTISTPLRADVWQGLMVVPIEGENSVHIVQGVVGFYDPDGQAGSSDPASPDADDSPYKIVKSAGINTNGVLVFGANASGLTRIDVVECRRQTYIDEQDNRDIFDPATGQFTPALVDKLEVGELVFRIRQGLPGAGLPANEQGWLPLAVAKVPDGFSTTDDLLFWDVRPLISDRQRAPFRGDLGAYAPMMRNAASVDINTALGEARLTGLLERPCPLSDFVAGGIMAKGDDLHIDLNAGDNKEPGYIPTAGAIVYLWACFPGGLPRWVQYRTTSISGSGRRIPFGPKGIIVLSTTAPSINESLRPFAPITMPASTGLDVTTQVGANLLAFPLLPSTTNICPVVIDGQWTYFGSDAGGLVGIVGPVSTGAGSLVADEYTLVEGTHFPAGARAIRGTTGMTLTGTIGNRYALSPVRTHVKDQAGGSLVNQVASFNESARDGTLSSAGTALIRQAFEAPRIPIFGASTSNIVLRQEWNASIAGGGTKASEFVRITGWKMSD